MREAFHVLTAAFDILNQVEMDGSNGEYSDIASWIADYWVEIIARADQQLLHEMFDWFYKAHDDQKYDLTYDEIDEVLFQEFPEEYSEQLIQLVQKDLADSKKSWNADKYLHYWQEFIYQTGRGQDEYEAWLVKHPDNFAVKQIRLDKILYSSDDEEIIRYLEQELDDSQNAVWPKQKIKDKLIELYRKTGKRKN